MLTDEAVGGKLLDGSPYEEPIVFSECFYAAVVHKLQFSKLLQFGDAG
ncbi:hypothetical protein [Paradesulfitobacterium ferrireducens]|nr:hypothetical protein [Paradesulfitobacterium ferrireducens]